MKKTILLLIVISSTVCVHAQRKFGIKAGYNLSGIYNISGSVVGDAPAPDWGMKSGFQGGILGDFRLNRSFYLQPSLMFSMQGFKDEYESNGSAKRLFSLYYLQVPINLQYKLDLGEPKLIFQAGPYAGLGLFSRQRYFKKDVLQKIDDKYKKLETTSNKKNDDSRPSFDFGVGVGVGVQLLRFQLMAGYNFGFTEISFDKDVYSRKYDIKMKNHGLFITLTCLFGKDDVLLIND
ncbi:MAG: PorT family protein [Bacteroidales bacterium]|nr:PorT family protein [Bacteroidales bacterium]